MTKTELLQDLSDKPWVDHFIGPEELRDTLVSGAKLYSQKVMDVGVETAVENDIFFFVIAEGEGGERAFYKSASPESEARSSEFYKWLVDTIENNPDNYKGFQIRWISEKFGMIIYSVLEGAGPLDWVTYYVRISGGSPVAPPVAINSFDVSQIFTRYEV